jgi:hypothetical protein
MESPPDNILNLKSMTCSEGRVQDNGGQRTRKHVFYKINSLQGRYVEQGGRYEA